MPDEEEVLKLGLNFAPTLRTVPVVDLLAGVEVATRNAKLQAEEAEELRARICCVVKNTDIKQDNKIPSLRRALGSLKKNDSIVILKADKGNATVVLDKGSYGEKCEVLLQPPTYKILTKNPTHKYNRKITELLKDLKTAKCINKVLFDRLKPSNTKAPRFYGRPKIYKPDMPLRPIVSAIGSPTYSLA